MPGLISVAESDVFPAPKSDQYETRKMRAPIAKDAIPVDTGIPDANEVFGETDARLDQGLDGPDGPQGGGRGKHQRLLANCCARAERN